MTAINYTVQNYISDAYMSSMHIKKNVSDV
jgi:hypothetical protein